MTGLALFFAVIGAAYISDKREGNVSINFEMVELDAVEYVDTLDVEWTPDTIEEGAEVVYRGSNLLLMRCG